MLSTILQTIGLVAGLAFIGYGFCLTGKDWLTDEKERSFEEHVEELIEMIKEK